MFFSVRTSQVTKTYHLIMRLDGLFAALIGLVGFRAVNASLEHCTGWWLLSQTALPAKMSPTGSLRHNKLLLPDYSLFYYTPSKLFCVGRVVENNLPLSTQHRIHSLCLLGGKKETCLADISAEIIIK